MMDCESRPGVVALATWMMLILGILVGPAAPAVANDDGETLQGLPALGEAEMGDFRSKRFEERWHGIYIPEPKPSKVGKTDLPKFGGDTARPFDGTSGASRRSPFSGLRAPPSEVR